MDHVGVSSGRFIIRNTTPEDAGAIAAIQVKASRAAYSAAAPSGYFNRLTIPNRKSAWSEMIASHSDIAQIIVAEENSDVRGYAHFGGSRDPDARPNVGELYSVYVDPSHWRRGLGKLLLDASLRGLAFLTFDSATLWVLAVNRRAIAFYERFGWIADGCEKATPAKMIEVRYRISTHHRTG